MFYPGIESIFNQNSKIKINSKFQKNLEQIFGIRVECGRPRQHHESGEKTRNCPQRGTRCSREVGRASLDRVFVKGGAGAGWG